jgi:hypothetical protein
MSPAHAYSSRYEPRGRSASSRRARLERLDRLATLLDSAIVIPGTGFRVGLDALIGLAPVAGDIVTSLAALWIVKEAHALGAPRSVLARMLANVAIDGALGAVPVLGDVFDTVWRANRRNIRILKEHFAREEGL